MMCYKCCKAQGRCSHSHSGFSLIELWMVLAIMGVLLTFMLPSWENFQERSHLQRTTNRITEALRQAQFLALTQKVSHRLDINASGTLVLNRTVNNVAESLIWDELGSDLTYSANRWPSFSASGLASGGTVTITSNLYEQKIVVSSMGKITQKDLTSL